MDAASVSREWLFLLGSTPKDNSFSGVPRYLRVTSALSRFHSHVLAVALRYASGWLRVTLAPELGKKTAA